MVMGLLRLTHPTWAAEVVKKQSVASIMWRVTSISSPVSFRPSLYCPFFHFQQIFFDMQSGGVSS